MSRCFFPSLHGGMLLFPLLLCLGLCSCSVRGGSDPDAAVKKRTAVTSAMAGPEARAAFDEAVRLWSGALASTSAAERCADPAQAVALLDKALALEPEYAEAYIRRGLARSELGQRDGAFDDLTAGIRLSPTPEAYAYRGLVSLRARQETAAMRDLEYSLSLDGAQHLANNFLGVLALGGDRKREACSRFDKGCANGDCSFLESARKENICP